MNSAHLAYLVSDDWKDRLKSNLEPWIDSSTNLGEDLLEIGPGPGLTTDILRTKVRRVTAMEIDPALAASLAERMTGSNVEVLLGDAANMPFETGRFSAATAFTMLHHVPTAEQQDAIFAEIHRVLRPGASFYATDTRDLEIVRAGHVDDTFLPLPPETLKERLVHAGFADVELEVTEYEIRFSARKAS